MGKRHVGPGYDHKTQELAREAAWRGYCELLKADFPFDKIDLPELQMDSPDSCMMGQGFGDYSKGIEEILYANDISEPWYGWGTEVWARENGFDYDTTDPSVRFLPYMLALNDAWKDLVEQHRTLGRAFGWHTHAVTGRAWR
jgi:hypothetical protein